MPLPQIVRLLFLFGSSDVFHLKLDDFVDKNKLNMDEVLRSCHKVYIQRDYSNGMAVQFDKNIPRELEGKVEYFHCLSLFVVILLIAVLCSSLI